MTRVRWGRRPRGASAATDPASVATADVSTPAPASTTRTASVCSAPESALYLRPDGLVMTCCGGWHVLGRVTGPDRRSLGDIWRGEARDQLRAEVRRGSYELGCFACKVEVDRGQDDTSLARAFDRYGDEPRAFPALIDFALSDRCNLQCVQCSGTFSSAIRRHREGREPLAPAYDDRLFDELDEFLPHLERAQFKGGEPYLMRESRRVWDRLLDLDLRPEVCITTNGTIWNDRVARYTEELGFDVIVSVDAIDDPAVRAIRVGTDPERLWRNIDGFRDVTRSTGRSLQLSFCLMSINWDQLAPFLRTCDRLGAGPDIIWVGGPGAFSLLTMPHDELADALVAMEAVDRELGDLSEASAALWAEALGQVRSSVEAGISVGVPVSVGRRSAGAAPVAERLAGVEAELIAGGAPDATTADLLRLAFRDEVLTEVVAPPWAAWLQVESWRGMGLRETMSTFATAAGGIMHTEVEPLEGGAHRVRLRFGSGVPVRALRGVSVLDPDDPGWTTLLFAADPWRTSDAEDAEDDRSEVEAPAGGGPP